MNTSSPNQDSQEPVVIKKYANRRLYNTETSTYVTLDDLGQMVRSNRDFVVKDAKSGDDLTHSVLTQIIVDQESRAGGPTLLPIPFLRQLIRYYDNSIARMVPGYLQFSLEALTKEQERFRSQMMHNPWSSKAFEAYQDQARHNLEVFERAMAMWSPFNPQTDKTAHDATAAPSPQHAAARASSTSTAEPDLPPNVHGKSPANPPAEPTAETNGDASARPEIDQLKAELAAMQKRIENLSKSDES